MTKGNLDYIFLDLWGPCHVLSKGGVSYFISFIDIFSKKVWMFIFKYKFVSYLWKH